MNIPKSGEKYPSGITVLRVNEGVVHYSREGTERLFEAPVGLWDVLSASREEQKKWASVQQVKRSRAAIARGEQPIVEAAVVESK